LEKSDQNEGEMPTASAANRNQTEETLMDVSENDLVNPHEDNKEDETGDRFMHILDHQNRPTDRQVNFTDVH
jgi:hypothetical protein